jgi:hypothetical protein
MREDAVSGTPIIAHRDWMSVPYFGSSRSMSTGREIGIDLYGKLSHLQGTISRLHN